MVARGWSPTVRQRRIAYGLVGLVLVFSPVLVQAFLADTTYTYAAREVSVEGDSIDVPDELFSYAGDISGIDCSGFSDPARCAYEADVAAGEGEAMLDADTVRRSLRSGYVKLRGRLYQRTVRDVNESVVAVDFEAVSAAAVARNVSREMPDESGPIRRAVESGNATTGRFVGSPALVQYGGTYYLFVQTDESDLSDDWWLPAAVAVGLGLAALWRRQQLADTAA